MIDFSKQLENPAVYDHKPKSIQVIQTHISWVSLTGKYAYKIKKPVNFGFLDFSTLEKRKAFCEKELKVNKRFSPDVYISVLPITKTAAGLRIGGSGKPVEYCIKMKELPQDRLMSKLLAKKKITKTHIDNIARSVACVYAKEKSTPAMRKVSLAGIKYSINENFEQTRDFIGKLFDKKSFGLIKSRVLSFMRRNNDLLKKRSAKTVMCHGDLHSGNIFIADKIYIFDAIEFNERFVYLDPAADVAFFAMDLDFNRRKDLADFFIRQYVKYSRDKGILDVLDFYKCYRAYVRAKVNGLMSVDQHLGSEKRAEAAKTSRKYFDLALGYTKNL